MSHYTLGRFCQELEQFLPRCEGQQDAILKTVIQGMQKLLSNPDLLDPDFVGALKAGHTDGRVYTSPEQGFFVQVFAWPPGVETPVHDHNTWGVMGILENQLAVTEYQMLPTDTEGQFQLKELDRFNAGPGAIVYVSMPDAEIHHIRNPTEAYSFSVHIYGAELENTHVFDLESGQVRSA